MVRIVRPRFDQVQNAPVPQPLAPLGASPDVYGAGISQGLVRMGLGMNEVAQREKHKANQIAVQEASAQAEHWLTGRLVQLDRKQGKAAMEDAAGLMAEYQAQLGAIEGGLQGEQRDMFRAGYSIEAQVRTDRLVQQKLGAVKMKYDDDTTLGSISAMNDSAASIAASGGIGVVTDKDGNKTIDDSAIQDQLNKIVAMRVLWYQRNGDRVEGDVKLAAKNAIKDDVSKFHAQVTSSVMANPGGDEVALAYFNAHKNEIYDPVVRANLQKTLTSVSETGEAERLALGAYNSIYQVEKPNESEPQRYDRARKAVIGSPKAVALLKTMRDGDVEIETGRRNAALDSLFTAIRGGASDADVQRQAAALDLGDDGNAAVEKMLVQRPHGGNALEQKSNYYKYRDMSSSTDPKVVEQFQKMDLYPLQADMGEDDWKQLKARQDDMNTPEKKADALEGTRSPDQALAQWVDAAYPNYNATFNGEYAYPEKHTAATQFKMQADYMIEAEQHNLKRKLTAKEIDELIGPLTHEVVFKQYDKIGNWKIDWLDRDEAHPLLTMMNQGIPNGVLIDAYQNVLARGGTPTDQDIWAEAKDMMAHEYD